jgi:hypothetical protein
MEMTEQHDPTHELNELSPLLSQLKQVSKSDGFQTPTFYFDDLSDKIMERVQTQSPPPKRWQLPSWLSEWRMAFGQPRLTWALATCTTVMIGAWFWMQSPKMLPATAEKDELHAYLEAHLDDLDEELLWSHHSGEAENEHTLSTELLEKYLTEEEVLD